MFQNFESTTHPGDGGPRLAALRAVLRTEQLDGFLVPRADAHQGENVPARDERLAWLTGFTGSAGFCAALINDAGVFVDGRYGLQVRTQIDQDYFTPLDWPATGLAEWLIAALPDGGVVGFDAWLYPPGTIEKLRADVTAQGISIAPVDNLIDRIWTDQPAPPNAKVVTHSIDFAGETSQSKRDKIAEQLRRDSQRAAVLSLPDSINWLLNIRGGDVAHTPVALCFAILHDSGRVNLFIDANSIDADVLEHFGPDISIFAPDDFASTLQSLSGPVRLDGNTAPMWIADQLHTGGIEIADFPDPCLYAKACKNAVEIEGARLAHLRDAVAMADLLAWIDAQGDAPEITEIDVVQRLESLRARSNSLKDIAFETICGAGENGAIVHYRVTTDSNRAVQPGDLLLIDSGGQYLDGTTDVTRTVAIGNPNDVQKQCFTRVLQGMIAISLARWPEGLAGRDLDPLARRALWSAGLDYDHGTGHGVGSYLGVHEGPQSLSRKSHVSLAPGMIVSNEPGYYRAGEFGIRIENLVVVEKAAALKGGDARDMLKFETLTLVPIARNLIDIALLTAAERMWINAYHAEIMIKIAPECAQETRDWLTTACAPL